LLIKYNFNFKVKFADAAYLTVNKATAAAAALEVEAKCSETTIRKNTATATFRIRSLFGVAFLF
jgi:hypothetical protein